MRIATIGMGIMGFIDGDPFHGDAPKRPFDADRSFRWQKYRDYGTAVAGDLFVHLLTAIHVATGSLGPARIASMGGRRSWDEGREIYDLILRLLDYPETSAHPESTLSPQTDFEDGDGEYSLFRFVGSDGVIDVRFDGFKVGGVGITRKSSNGIPRDYNSVTTFSKAQQEAFVAKIAGRRPEKSGGKAEHEAYRAPEGYDARYDHLVRPFASVLEGKPVEEDATFGYRAAAPALQCNDSLRQGKLMAWDPVVMWIPG